MSGAPVTATHDALVYDTDEELLASAVPFLRTGLDTGDAVVVVCGARKNALLLEALGGDERVIALAQSEVYQRPPAAVAAYARLVRREVAAGTPHVRVLGELDADGPEHAWGEWIRYESMLNHAFVASPVSVVCGYDARMLPAEVIAGAERTHPNLATERTRTANPNYVEPAEYLRLTGVAEWDAIEAEVPSWQTDTDTAAGTAELRRALRAAMIDKNVPAPAIEDFVLAANEVASNALVHGRRPVRIRLWVTPTRSVCTVADRGQGFDDPFAGYLHPGDGEHGRGLWLARRLCDTVQTSRRDGLFTVRLCLHHEPAGRG